MRTNQIKLEQAQRLHQQGQLHEALKLLKLLKKQAPNDVALIQRICIIYVQIGGLEQAELELSHAIKHLPNDPSLYNSLGNIAMRKRNYVRAVDAYHEALARNPDYPGALNNLGNAYLSQNKLLLAEQSYRKALRIDPLYPDAHFNLARLHIQNNHPQSAITHLKKVIEIIPQHAGAQGLIANALLQLGDLENAVLHLKARLSIQPNHAESHQVLGTAYLQLKQYRLAIEHLSYALQNNPNLDEINSQLATAYLLYGNREEALKYYLQSVTQNPGIDLYYNIGVIYSDMQRHSDALSQFKQALKLEPNHLPTHLNMAAVYLKTSEITKAINHYQKAQMLDPKNLEIKHTLHALQQDITPQTAPTQYCQNLFDHYATGYEKHLLDTLKYTVPQQLHHLIMTEVNPKNHSLKILDLGCGTGLVAEQFEFQAQTLIGIDISANMLEKARQKNLYQKLHHQSLETALNNYRELDLIVAADVFPYLGSLNEVFHKSKMALKNGGFLAFSIEKTTAEDFVLQKNIRYAHNKKYIESLSKTYKFTVLSMNNSILRNQHQKPVEGYIFLLKVNN